MQTDFLSYLASFYTTFHKHRGREECLRTATYSKLLAVVSKGMLPVKYSSTSECSLVAIEFHEDDKIYKKLR